MYLQVTHLAWIRIKNTIDQNKSLDPDNHTKLPYQLMDQLLYFDDDKKDLRLCIPTSIDEEVFKPAHDEFGHPGYARTHERLTHGL